MNLADVFTVLFSILGTLAVYVSYCLLAAGLFPTFVENCSRQIGRAPVKTTLLGLVTFGPLFAIGLAISGKAPNGGLKVLGLALAFFALLLALLGSAGLAWRVGGGLKSQRDELEPWRRMLRGGIVLALSFVLPVLGTFIVLPVALLSGFGAFLIGRFSSSKNLPAPAAVLEPLAPFQP